MPWMKIDDSFESHPKVKSIPKGKRTKAIGLWTLAGSWCARHLTDGFVPAYMVGELGGTKAESSLLVAACLWHEVDDGFTFHDWTDHQPSRAKVEEERDAAKERMRAARERKKGTSSRDVRANTSERTRTNTENFANGRSVTPSRPVPTRPDPEGEESGDKSPTPPGRSLALVKNDRADVTAICEALAQQIEARGSKRPTITERWRTEARLLLDSDGRTEPQVQACIRWLFTSSHRDAQFWRTNIRSMPKLRTEYDRLRELAERPTGGGDRNQQQQDLLGRAMARAQERERNGA